MSPLVDSQTKGAEDIKRVMANNVDINIGRVVLSPSTRKLLMDQATVSSLELIRGTRGTSDTQVLQGSIYCHLLFSHYLLRHCFCKSLYKMLKNTQTMAGNRLLRSTFVCSSQARHEVVGIFLDNPAWFFDVMEELRDFVDLDRLLSRLGFRESP
uniref:DNA mismatch repair protein MutS core domain-containing protein n=1 Tax=Hyaloperonospora arabidopsidis (strain Emoy2) TaxID=559515 RepID=M4B949_HYAAE